MAELTDKDIDAALARGQEAASVEPRAASARYDRRLDRIVVELTNGCTFAFPPRLAQVLEQATEDELAEVEVMGAGYGLHWETLHSRVEISRCASARLPGGRRGTRADTQGLSIS